MLVPGNLFLFDMPIQRVDWAEPEIEVDEVVMAQVSHPGATLARLLPIVVMALDFVFDIIITESEIIESVPSQAAQLGIHFLNYISFTTHS